MCDIDDRPPLKRALKLIAFELAAKFLRRRENPVQPRLCNAKNAIFKRLKTGVSLQSHIHTYTYIHTYTTCRGHSLLEIHIQTHIHTCIHTYIHTYTQWHVTAIACLKNTYTLTYMHTCIHTYIHTYTQRHVAAIACLKRALYLDPFEWIISYNLVITYMCVRNLVHVCA
jgi:hypothetical protein